MKPCIRMLRLRVDVPIRSEAVLREMIEELESITDHIGMTQGMKSMLIGLKQAMTRALESHPDV